MTTNLNDENRPAPRRYSVWVCIAMNQLAFPGMGTVMAGRRVGYAQAAIMLAGFFLLMAYFAWLFLGIFRYITTGNEFAWREQLGQYAWTWQSGLVLSLIAWFWALASSIRLWQENKENQQNQVGVGEQPSGKQFPIAIPPRIPNDFVIMTSNSLTVVAHIKAKPGQEDKLRQELLALVPTTRKEPGCLNYDLHQASDNPALFLFHENWTSKQHLDDHLARPHLQALLGKADELLAEPPQITLWNKIG